ncbi:MAG: sporulation protein YqfD [Spirochaetaceae bacterium]|nr:sporulation protein YqfD [Spirochaetaceae bacterium]
MKLNRIFFLVLFLLIGSFSFAVSYPLFQSSNRTLEDAHSAFDSKDYGAALRLAEEAKIIRRQEVSECLEILDQALKPFAVRSAGDLITDVRSVLLKRDVFDAVELPIYYSVTTYAEYEERETEIDVKRARELAYDRYAAFIGSRKFASVENENLNEEIRNGCFVLSGTVDCIEDIAQEKIFYYNQEQPT